MPWVTNQAPGRSWSSNTMAVTAKTRTNPSTTVTIELDERTPVPTAHRLSELVQALAGCSIERAELALGDPTPDGPVPADDAIERSEEHTSELRSLMRNSYAGFCWKK